jgi:phosphatidylglycerophosphate synthase
MSLTPHGLLPSRFEQAFVKGLQPLAAGIGRAGISANGITLLSLVFAAATGALLALGHLRWALLPGVVMGFCDILDGLVAKSTQRESAFGAILDSAVDRYAEFLLFAGFGIYFGLRGEWLWTAVAALALTGSFQVSYVKARAEGAGKACPVGLAQRSERLVLLAVGVLFGGWVLKGVLLALSLLAHYTAIQRLLFLSQSQKISQ